LDNHPKKQFTDSGDHPEKHFSVKYNHVQARFKMVQIKGKMLNIECMDILSFADTYAGLL
jgi:predicted DNA-binding ArsR family transcriptional regulator